MFFWFFPLGPISEYFNAFNYKNFSCPALDEVLYPLQKSLSSEIKDFLRLMGNALPKRKIQHEINKCFYSSMDDDWENIIIDWLKKAQSSIQIISPLILSEKLSAETVILYMILTEICITGNAIFLSMQNLFGI